MSSTFLTRKEMKDLTGYTYKSKQIEWLTEHRWPFELDSFGWPVVLRSVMECKLGITATKSQGFELDESLVA